VHHVILGNGIAGIEAALALRRREGQARISVVSDEHDHLYSRPALMYVFAGQLSLRDTEPYDRGLYERMRFERVARRVASLDAPSRALVLEDGSRLAYDRLLLAVGSKARPAPWPGSDGAGLHYFVTLRDLERLDRDARSGRRAAVVGGGLIGVEVAEILRQRGLDVSFLIRENWYFPMALDGNESALVGEHMRRHGCDVRLGATVERILRDAAGNVTGLRLADGAQIACDLVCASIGVVPNTGFLAGSGLALSKGGAIEVDGALRTSLPDVWAAGDCANVTWHDGSGIRPATRGVWQRPRCWGTKRPTGAAPGTTRPSSSTSNGQRPAGCQRCSTGTTRRSIRAPTSAPGSSACRVASRASAWW
jgi:NAD(P)H-nitrite reductase large subunit